MKNNIPIEILRKIEEKCEWKEDRDHFLPKDLVKPLESFILSNIEIWKQSNKTLYKKYKNLRGINERTLRWAWSIENNEDSGAVIELCEVLCFFGFGKNWDETIKMFGYTIEELVKRKDIIKNKPIVLNVNKKERSIVEFVDFIGTPDNLRFEKIDELYVPPKEYYEIKKTLEVERIVFISGSPEYGKTYTAIKLLWEWFKNGYSPYYDYGFDEDDRIKVRKNLNRKADELKEGYIYYFEDPFGKNEYENKGGELEISIKKILLNIRSKERTYVIITTREDIFDEFKQKIFFKEELDHIEKKITIFPTSYDQNMIEQMVIKYGLFNNCFWIKDNYLKEFVINKIKKESILPTPLSIYNFSYLSKNDDRKEQIIYSLNLAQEERGYSFAHEIDKLKIEEKIFFTILFLQRNTKNTFLIEKYFFNPKTELITKFNEICYKYRNNKIELISFKTNLGFFVRLSHPSYYNAWKYLSRNSFYRDIASDIILSSGNYGKFWLWVKNYSLLNEKAINTFLSFLEKETYSRKIAYEIIINYENISVEVRNFISKIFENNNIRHEILNKISKDFDNFPIEVQNFIEEYDDEYFVSYLFNKWKTNKYIPNAIRLILKIIREGRASVNTLMGIIYNYRTLSKEIIDQIPVILNNIKLEFNEYLNVINIVYDQYLSTKIEITNEEFYNKHCYFEYEMDIYDRFDKIFKVLRNIHIKDSFKKSIIKKSEVEKWIISHFVGYIVMKKKYYWEEDNWSDYKVLEKYINREQATKIKFELTKKGFK